MRPGSSQNVLEFLTQQPSSNPEKLIWGGACDRINKPNPSSSEQLASCTCTVKNPCSDSDTHERTFVDLVHTAMETFPDTIVQQRSHFR
ncbi:hypothetical protein AVEN_83729-1 [Araneus ventricosus]|uniref:Uncharacterized protein n=1 Tax=Araneus ventricosus TaxID=182803 RepID=A0A4Y2EWS7_ARAVE|nr:hypothetical protein AVEN_83729-1 [Araneus ventricosus]